MVTDNIKIKAGNKEVFDKKQIALAIRNATYDDELECSLIEENIIKNCNGCGLKKICDGIDGIYGKYIEDTTKVVNSFIL